MVTLFPSPERRVSVKVLSISRPSAQPQLLIPSCLVGFFFLASGLMARFFGFPNPVNETSARIVATGAVLMGVAYAATGWGWILVPLTYGFIARVLTGPKMSPLGRLATQVITPRLKFDHVMCPGPPKRFAQGIGATFSIVASVLHLAGASGAARVVIAVLVVAASLEAFLGFCLGCWMFGWLMRWGVIPESICAECNDISARLEAARARQAAGSATNGS